MPRKLYNYPRPFAQLDISGGLQVGTSHLLRKRNEVVKLENAVINYKIGSARRRMGYEKVATTIEQGNDSLGAAVYRYGQNNKIVTAINNTANTAATLRFMDTGGYWTNLLTNAQANTRFQMLNDLDELYVAGFDENTSTYLPLTNVSASSGSPTISTSHNVYTAPASKFIAEYNGVLIALNCYVNGKYYYDRAYLSSPALGYITLVQTDQAGLLNQLRVNSAQYLKVGMSLDIYGAGTEAKKVSGLTIVSVDKKNNRISFGASQITVADNDEIWLTGTKGTLSRFWNTDYKTPETADWFKVPASKSFTPVITGWGKNNNRFFIFTRNSFTIWDGQNLITKSDNIGCVSHETIQNIGSWTLWLHDTGVWGYNDNTGQFQLLSTAVKDYIDAINQSNLRFASAGVVGKVYKLAVGELMTLSAAGNTTSTSTSSTTFTTTSTSTSSTSTSSTSTSSTTLSTSTSSTSVSTSSTSVSTTSSSTSSTSHSTSSTSSSSTSSTVSTSTSSTTTSTVASTKQVVRLCYDMNLNGWWTEKHKREIRFQFTHTMNGYTKPYFTDETGRLFRDETTNTDNGEAIPMEIEWGRNNLGTDQQKRFNSLLIDSENARGAILKYSVDSGPFVTLCQIVDNVQRVIFPASDQSIEGRDIDYKVTHNDAGEPPMINGITTYTTFAELVVDA